MNGKNSVNKQRSLNCATALFQMFERKRYISACLGNILVEFSTLKILSVRKILRYIIGIAFTYELNKEINLGQQVYEKNETLEIVIIRILYTEMIQT